MRSKALGGLLAAALSLSPAVAIGVQTAYAAGGDTAATEYTLYPKPHSIRYDSGQYILRDINVIYDDDIDEATQDRLDEVAALKNLNVTESDAAVSGKTNVYVGVNGSDGKAETAIESKYSPDSAIFDKTDSYFLKSDNGTISVLGKDTDASFYGLTTLYQVLGQIDSLTIRNFTVTDYADVVSRGFIEGYYGNPWSTQDRINLMKWGGYYKLNSYFYAPKDDPKHNSQWRTLYTQDELDTKIKPLADAGNASKTRFVFALHPFMNNAIRFNSEANYQADLKVLQDKFAQTIGVGVRQIAILADDAANVGGNNYTKLLTDMVAWLKEMKKTYPDLKTTLPFVTQEYMGNGMSYFANFPKEVQIVMTGGRVWGEVSQNFTDTFTSNVGRGPYMWINWPCSDNSKSHLIMGGYDTFLHPGVDPSKIQGIVLNPMQQSEPSKQGIFMAADYSWNLWQSEKDGQQSWEDSFSYIDHNSPIASKGSRGLRDLAMNMRILNDGGIDGAHKDAEYDAVNKWWINNESVDYTGKLDVKGVLTELKGKLDGGTATAADFSQALTVYTTLQRAAKNYRANPGDKNMFDQIEPWISYWDDLTASAIDYITAAKQALAGDTEAAKATYATAKAAFAKSDTHTIADYYQRNKPARGGLVIVRPTVQALDSFVKAKTSGSVTPMPSDATVNTNGVGAAAWHENVDPKAVIDGDDSTFFWMQSAGCDCVKANAALTVTYAEARKAKEFRFIQAEKGGDTIVNGKIEYQDADGNWTKIGDVNGNQKQIFTLDSAATVKAVRITNLAQTSKWWKVYDLSATKIDEPGTVTKDALNAKIAEAEKVDSTDWTKSSREALAGAIAAAKAVAADQDATQAKVDAAVAALESAMKGVERYTAKTADQLKAEHVSNDDATYTEASYNKYQSAYDDFAAALANADDLAKADGEALEAAYTAAKSALRYDQSARDYAQLALNDAEPYVGKASEYTKDSYAKFTVAYEALSKQLKADPNGEGDPATYTALRAALDKAIKGLVKSDGTEPEQPGEKPGENKPGEKPGVNKPGADGKLSNTGADVFGLIAAMTMLAAAGVTMAGLRKRIG